MSDTHDSDEALKWFTEYEKRLDSRFKSLHKDFSETLRIHTEVQMSVMTN